MTEQEKTVRVCPICGKEYMDRPALSRIDNETLICPDCGTRQSLSAIGVPEDQQEKIIEIIHNSGRGEN